MSEWFFSSFASAKCHRRPFFWITTELCLLSSFGIGQSAHRVSVTSREESSRRNPSVHFPLPVFSGRNASRISIAMCIRVWIISLVPSACECYPGSHEYTHHPESADIGVGGADSEHRGHYWHGGSVSAVAQRRMAGGRQHYLLGFWLLHLFLGDRNISFVALAFGHHRCASFRRPRAHKKASQRFGAFLSFLGSNHPGAGCPFRAHQGYV